MVRRTTLMVAAVLAIGAGLSLLGAPSRPAWLPCWLVWLVGLGSAAVALNELLGTPAFFLRWSVIRMGLGARSLLRTWQVGDGREQKVADFVVANARAGDVDHAIQIIDEFGYEQSFLMNVGDEKGEILDAALRRSGAKRVLEVGAYVGDYLIGTSGSTYCAWASFYGETPTIFIDDAHGDISFDSFQVSDLTG